MDQDRSAKLLRSVSFSPRMWIYLKGGTLLMPNALHVALASSVFGILAVALGVLTGGQVKLPTLGQGIAALAFGVAASAAGNLFLKEVFLWLNQVITARSRFVFGATQCLSTGGLVWLTVVLSNDLSRKAGPDDGFYRMFGDGLGADWIFTCFGGSVVATLLLLQFYFSSHCVRWLQAKAVEGWRAVARVNSWRAWARVHIESSTTAAQNVAGSVVKALRKARSVAISKGVGDADGWARIESAALSKTANKSSSPSKPPLRL